MEQIDLEIEALTNKITQLQAEKQAKIAERTASFAKIIEEKRSRIEECNKIKAKCGVHLRKLYDILDILYYLHIDSVSKLSARTMIQEQKDIIKNTEEEVKILIIQCSRYDVPR